MVASLNPASGVSLDDESLEFLLTSILPEDKRFPHCRASPARSLAVNFYLFCPFGELLNILESVQINTHIKILRTSILLN